MACSFVSRQTAADCLETSTDNVEIAKQLLHFCELTYDKAIDTQGTSCGKVIAKDVWSYACSTTKVVV